MTSLSLTLPILLCCCLVTGCADSTDPAIGADEAKATKPPNPNKPPNPGKPPKDDPPAPPVLLTWYVRGLLADNGLYDGRFTYDAAAVPTMVEGDAYYDLTDWQITVAETYLHPAISFTKSETQTATLCVGVCVQFSLRGLTKVEHVEIDNGSQRFQFEWLLPDGVTLPQTIDQWGNQYFPGCWLRWRYIPNVTNDYLGVQTLGIYDAVQP